LEDCVTKKHSIGIVLAAIALGLGALGAPACNNLTGVDELVVGGEGLGGLEPLAAVKGIGISEIALYQGIKRPLMAGGQAVAEQVVPIVIGREALVRVFVTTTPDYDGEEVTARFFFAEDKPPIEVTQKLAGASTDDKLASTINLKIPGEVITKDFQYHVEIGRLGESGSDAALAYPAKGFEAVPTESVGESLKITLVPIQYDADGSGRLPDTSPEQLKTYEDAFRAMYPVPKVEITVREPMPWKQDVSPNGFGWSQLLDRLASTRESDNAPSDVYYYGIVDPADKFSSFCGGGCVAGLGMTGSANDAWARAAIGLGYGGQNIATETALHEIGHTHGRLHAPCQTQDADGQYPHQGGKIGFWGYDMVTEELFDPGTADIMGYCDPSWISDYTYKALFDRARTVNNVMSAKKLVTAEERDQVYERVLVDGTGGVQWLEPMRLREPPSAEEKTITLEGEGGASEARTGQFYPFDHLDGGILFFRSTAKPAKAIRLQLGARDVRVTR
jgi:hypothetical protein